MLPRFRVTAAFGANAFGAEPVARDLSERPVTAALNVAAVILLEILRPLCWEALILLYLVAVFGSS